MNALTPEPDISFPGESEEYRQARNRLLEAEIEVRRGDRTSGGAATLAAARRSRPPGLPVRGGGGGRRRSHLLRAVRAGKGHARRLQLHVPALVRRHEARPDERRHRAATAG